MESIKRFLGPRDPKMLSYPLMESVLPTLLFSLLYLVFVLFAGPAWMRGRRPFLLRGPLLAYNGLMVVVNCFLLAQLIKYGWSKYNWRCEPMDFSDSEMATGMSRACWWLYISKLVEYCDTIFFVLRKKDNQVNFLHVFHHSSVPITAWFGVNYGPSGFNMIFPTVNTFIHIWMYLYYGLSALGPGLQKYLWWKKYLTTLQLAQFVFVALYFSQLVLFPVEGCRVPPFLFALSMGQALLYLALFAHFYCTAYTGTAPTRDTSRRENGNSHAHRTKLQ